jgi:hypothetical protein
MMDMHIYENVSLKLHSTMRLGGNARYMCTIRNEADLLEALDFAEKKDIPFRVIGSGSNIIWKDEGFLGLLIINRIANHSLVNKTTMRFAINAGMTADQMCIGHAMEMDPSYHQVILFEIARSLMTRQIFPDSPLKYMCNTKYKTGDIFTSHAIDTIFNFIGSLTDQGMILLGMPTEAVHTPFLQDRSISIRNANYVLGGSFGISSEVAYRKDGVIAKFSEKVLDDALNFLERVNKVGIFKAIEKAYFADVVRTPEGGKGGNGVFAVDRAVYLNPFFKLMGSRI